MKGNADLVQGWLRKARSDMLAMEATAAAGAMDAACFHAQQAVEKLLKGYLAQMAADFPRTHNLTKLVELCAERDESFIALLDVVAPLTPYAVELRYDQEFWPGSEAVEEARGAAERVLAFVLERLSDLP